MTDTFDIDALIDDAAIYGELSSGTSADWLAAHESDPRRLAIMANNFNERPRGKEAFWSTEDEVFLRENYMTMSDPELAEALGRTVAAIHIRRERVLQLVARTKRADWINSHEIMRMLGATCSKPFPKLIKMGVLRGRMLPLEGKAVWVVHFEDLKRFVVNPMNWIYFRSENVQDPDLHRLIERQRLRWNDAWWTPGQVAAYHGVSVSLINMCVRDGRLKGVRWNNWNFLKSEVIRFGAKKYLGKGCGYCTWTQEADSFLMLARAVGFSYRAIAMMIPGRNFPEARSSILWRSGRVEDLCLRASYPMSHVKIDVERRALYADYRNWPGKFPYLERAVKRFRAGVVLDGDEIRLMLGVFCNWLAIHAKTVEQEKRAKALSFRTNTTATGMRSVYAELEALGFTLE